METERAVRAVICEPDTLSLARRKKTARGPVDYVLAENSAQATFRGSQSDDRGGSCERASASTGNRRGGARANFGAFGQIRYGVKRMA
jgi:hypothetical protein